MTDTVMQPRRPSTILVGRRVVGADEVGAGGFEPSADGTGGVVDDGLVAVLVGAAAEVGGEAAGRGFMAGAEGFEGRGEDRTGEGLALALFGFEFADDVGDGLGVEDLAGAVAVGALLTDGRPEGCVGGDDAEGVTVAGAGACVDDTDSFGIGGSRS